MKEYGAIHEWTGPQGDKFRDIRAASGTYYRDTTAPQVVAILESAQRTGERLRLFTGDTRTGKCWNDECGTTGAIGCSMGPHRIPLLIANGRSSGGPGLLESCIIRIISQRGELYRHPKFHTGKFTLRAIKPDEKCGKVNLSQVGYTHGVDVDGKGHANFKSLAKAERYVAFMTGERLAR